jgi:hypothetical protein
MGHISVKPANSGIEITQDNAGITLFPSFENALE